MQKFRKLIGLVLALLLSVSLFSAVISPLTAKADLLDLWDLVDDLNEDDDDYYDDEDAYLDSEDGYDDEVYKYQDTLDPGNTTTTGVAYQETKTNNVSGYTAFLYDNAGLFAQTEARTLLNEIYQYTEYGDMVVLTTNENPYGNSESATDQFCEAFYQQYSKKDNCVIFIIDMKTRYLLVYSAGDVVEDNLTASKCSTITDNVYSYASDKDYYRCASEAYIQIGKVLAGMHIAQPMKVVSNVFISLVIGFVVMYLVAVGKSSVSKTSDTELLKYAAVNFNAVNPTDTITSTTKTYCPRSSGSSGGRSGGGGGGHSHSSGGHRF